MSVSFKCTREEATLVSHIIRRGSADFHPTELSMDLLACNANGCPLDFDKLLHFDHLDFIHDICGIQRHLERKTGVLKDGFLPRCAKPQAGENFGQTAQKSTEST